MTTPPPQARPQPTSPPPTPDQTTPWTLTRFESALRAAWSADTCSPDDAERTPWDTDNPALGHCDITALVVHDVFGGELLVGTVRSGDEDHGFHWWNRLPSGVELDLTYEQFLRGQVVGPARTVVRPSGPLRRRAEEYHRLRARVAEHLGAELPPAGN
jgi:hypothetical protein